MASDFKRPEEWSDEERMHFLLAPFPPNANPTLSDTKVTFWRALIYSSSRETRQWSFTKREMAQRLIWKRLEPKCLPAVIDALERTGELRRLSSYRIDEMGWMEWSMKVLALPVSWAWQRYVTPADQEVVYVIVSLVKELCELVISAHYQSVHHVITDSLVSHTEFEQLLQTVADPADKRSTQVLELQLLEDRMVSKGLAKETNEVVIKFAASRNDKALPVNEMDIGILSILKTITDLQTKLDGKNKNILSIKKECLECKRKGQKKEAINHFKNVKILSKSSSTLEAQLTNLRSILDQIQSAETNAKVLRAYESGAAALRQLREGVSIEKVEEVMDDIKELQQEGDEIDDVLAEDQSGLPEIDEADLLKELEELEKHDEGDIVKMKSLTLEDPKVLQDDQDDIVKKLNRLPEVKETPDKTSSVNKTTKLKPLLMS